MGDSDPPRGDQVSITVTGDAYGPIVIGDHNSVGPAGAVEADWLAERVRNFIDSRNRDWRFQQDSHLMPEITIEGAARLARLESLEAAFRQSGARWLIVHGVPGSGKSTLAWQHLVRLIAERQPGQPVPVFVPLTTWEPERDLLGDWLARQVTLDYLGTSARGGQADPRVRKLVQAGLVVPILDGFDEVPPPRRMDAVDRLRMALGGPVSFPGLVLTCRTHEYQHAFASHPLDGATTAHVLDLDRARVAGHLRDGDTADRWIAVAAEVTRNGSEVGAALAVPLYASLVTEAYPPPDPDPVPASPDGRAPPVPDPAELLDPARFPTAESIRRHLVSGYIRRRYRDRSSSPEAPLREQLAFLAARLAADRTVLQWWDVASLAPRWLLPVLAGSVGGISAGIVDSTGSSAGMGVGLLIALVIGTGPRVVRYWRDPRVHHTRYRGGTVTVRALGGILGGLLGGVLAGIAGAYHIGHDSPLYGAADPAISIGFIVGVCADPLTGFIGCLAGAFIAGYLENWQMGTPAGIVNGAAFALAIAVVVAFLARAEPTRRPGWDRTVGLTAGAVFGTASGAVVSLRAGPGVGIAFGLLFGLLATLAGLARRPQDPRRPQGPAASLRTDLSALALAAGAGMVVAGSLASLVSVYEGAPHWTLSWILADPVGLGLATGLTVAIGFGAYQAASARYLVAVGWLALRGRLPWRLMVFLQDAHARGILHQSGPAYQFRHEVLLRFLAAQEARPADEENAPRR